MEERGICQRRHRNLARSGVGGELGRDGLVLGEANGVVEGGGGDGGDDGDDGLGLGGPLRGPEGLTDGDVSLEGDEEERPDAARLSDHHERVQRQCRRCEQPVVHAWKQPLSAQGTAMAE